jgi:hypothetical protein
MPDCLIGMTSYPLNRDLLWMLLVENFESDAEETISSLEMTVLDLERELVETEIECRKLRKELSDSVRPLV